MKYRFLILGAGPTGLGAAWRLQELGVDDWCLLEAASTVGGLATSVVDPQGFTWDLGGHVLFSHYDYFDNLMDSLLGTEWLVHERESWVWIKERFVPYPLQNNIWRLPQEDLLKCLDGLFEASQGRNTGFHDFEEWIRGNFGDGLAEIFMIPYNWKVWAYPPAQLTADWVGERVATVDLKKIVRKVVLNKDSVSWGPNSRFRYPKRGGTGAIWKALFDRLPAEKIALESPISRIDFQRHQVTTPQGVVEYDYLLSSVPLDSLLRMASDPNPWSSFADRLRYSSSHIVGIGLQGVVPKGLETKCWMYFPEEEVPFYRVTVFSNYSPYNVPRPGEQWSLMCEVSESPLKPVESSRICDDVVEGLVRIGLVKQRGDVVSVWHRRLQHGYPTPFLGRDATLNEVDPLLRGHQVWSRGRFGGWKYEVSNQDHSLMQGVEAVDHILEGDPEVTYFSPSVVNDPHRRSR